MCVRYGAWSRRKYSRPRFKGARLKSTPRFKDDIFSRSRCPADIRNKVGVLY